MDMPFLKLVVSYFVLLTSFNVASSQVDIPAYYDHNCTNNNFTSESPYLFNLYSLLMSLYSKATATDTTAKFYNDIVGTPNMNDTVYGEYMCRGDVPMEVCRDCVQDATSRIASECPYIREAIIWYDQCSVRYSDRYFFSTLHQLPIVDSFLRDTGSGGTGGYCDRGGLTLLSGGGGGGCGKKSETIPTGVSESEYIELSQTLNYAVVEAKTSTKRFATKEAKLTIGGSRYALVQCTPDLSPQLCSECLYGLIDRIPINYTGSSGRILNPSCNWRSEGYQFYYKGNQPPSDFTVSESPSLAVGWNCSTTKANYTTNDPYLNNLGNLFEHLSKSSNITNNKGFYSTMVGNKSNTVYGLFMCRGDVSLQLCSECVSKGIKRLNNTCSSSKEAIIWYDMCMLRYSNRSFFSTLDTQPMITSSGVELLQIQKEGFIRLLVNTLSDLMTATTNSTPIGVKNFATKTVFSPSEFRTLYTLAQCTPNLTNQNCKKCLNDAQHQITSCCLGTISGKVMNPSCNLRFELYRFYNNYNLSAVSVPPAYPPNNSGVSVITGKNENNSRTLIIAVSLSIVSITLFCFSIYYWKRKKNQLNHKAILEKNFGSVGATLESLQFNFATIESATDKFSIENRIGKGGFGEVYMGVLSDGSKIAVKRLSENSSQGLIEFKNEVILIAKLQHRNLVALLGFCLKDQEKILVYEYVPNKSLDYLLFGSQKSRELNWPERYKIIEGIARGIHYLHEHSRLKVIHRDLKPSNILLDGEMNPKISDFGMARMVGINETRGSTNRIVGTLGYMSPEYLKFGLFSEKSDVFSFGVIVLEIISGKNIHSDSESHESQYGGGLLSDAWKHWRGENLIAILDSNLREETGSHSEIMRCIQIGLLCVQGNPQVRPSMNKVVKYLSNDSMKLPIPHEPAFFLHSQMEGAETNRAMEAQLANQDQNSINEISESVSFPR
ncbi:hypothetical protein QN277_005317 [Acacia crassicarpa]|uniref:Cysteine-rich receptor-like protein kinase n=1 Tax=Acacia crassicarpa TaxID=499986 RepID=A0AAE1M9M8_9FABA|nr:hypothetical protein QN277_005317 [Acacia crassicarpa]